MLPEFQHLYLATMHRVEAHSSYCYNLEYFEELREAWGASLHIASIVSPDGHMAASGLFTELHGIVQYHLSGTEERFMRLGPTKLLLDKVRHWAKERGNNVFHLGGGVSGEEDSLFAFKAAFSKHRGSFQTSRIITDHQRYQQAVAANRKDQLQLDGDYFPAYRHVA